MGAEPLPNALDGFGNQFLTLGCLAKLDHTGRGLVLPQLHVSGFVDMNGRPVPFQIKTEGQRMGADGGGKGKRGERQYSG